MADERTFRGWGSKQGSKVKTWKQRYFVFDGRDLVYYRAAAYDGSGKDEKGRLTVVDVDYAPSLKNGLLVRGDKPGQLLKMRTQDGEHTKHWFQAFKAAAEELKELRGSSLFGSFRERAGSSQQRSAPGSYAGWLWVEREDGSTAWIKRYMVLRGKVLSYYSHPSSPSVLHAVRIDAVTVNMSRAFALDLHLNDGEIVTIAGESSDEMQAWERSISTALNTNTAIEFDPPPMVITSPASYQAKQQQVSPSHHQLFGSPIPASPTTMARMGRASSVLRCEGWLEKKGSPSSKWHQRYFMLIGGMLTYHHGPKEPVCREEFVVDVQYGDPEATTLEIELESGDSIFVRAPSDVEQRMWMHALCDLVGKPSLFEDDEGDDAVAAGTTGIAPLNNNHHEELKPQTSTYSTAEVLFGRRVKRGWLLKEGQFIKSWKRRFFVLDGDTLHYYEVEDGPPKGNGIVMRVLRNSSLANALDIHCLNGRIIKISADTKEESDDWFQALHEATASHNAAANENEAPLLSKGKHQCGWLLKKGQQFKTWKRRYFMLERNRLVYYEAIEGDILGSGVVFDVSMGDARPYCLDVRFQNGRLLQIVAADQEEFTEWFKALQSASNMTESFLSQNNVAQESLEQEFDYDRGDDLGLDLDFTSEFVGGGVDNNLDDSGDGYSSWTEAMENKPEYGKASSWDSEGDISSDTDLVSAGGSRSRRDSDSSSVGSRTMGCHGWLHKEGGNFKTWKRRYFTLYGNKICYYKHESGALLRGYHVAQVASHPCKQFMFSMEVTTECGRKLLLAAENKDDYDMWLAALQDAVALADDDPLRLSTRGSQSSVSVHASEDGISGGCLSGWLEKEGHRFKTWKRRFFTLRNGALIYYAEPGAAALGHGIVTRVELDISKPHTLCIHLDNDRVLRVSAESRTELEVWYRALLPSSQEFDDEVLRGYEAHDKGTERSSASTEQQQAAVRNRFNEGDYLANDTVSNESFLRIRAVDDQKSFLSRSFKKKSRSFKGELSFSDASADSSSQDPKRRVATATIDSDDEDDLTYHRMLMAEQDPTLKGELPPPHGCAPCCSVS